MRIATGSIAPLLAALVFAAACAGGDSRPESTSTPSPTASAAPPAVTPDPTPTVEVNPQPVSIVPDWIAGLETVSDSKQGDPFPFFVTYPAIPGAAALNEALAEEVTRQIEAFAVLFPPGGPTPPPEMPAGPELNISFEFAVASGDVIGVRLLSYEFYGANGAETSTALWYDAATERALGSPGLLEGEAALEELARLSQDILLRDRPESIIADALEEGAGPTPENYDSLGFDEQGRLIVLFDEYQVGIGAAGPISIAIPPDETESLLSEFGRRVRDETMNPSPELVLPTPSPTPTPALTPAATPTATPTPSTAQPATPVAPSTVQPATPAPTARPPVAGRVDCGAVPCIALTFDDGPGRYTAELLDVLASRDVAVTFFTVGVNVVHQPALTARIVAEGHEIGNHTFDHRDLTTLSPSLVREQVESAQAAIRDATGAPAALLRPPYGATNDVSAENVGLPQIVWTVDTRDWADRDAAIVTSRALDGAAAGRIILMHDIHASTVAAVPAIVDGLLAEGYRLVTVSDLLAGRDLVPGNVYRQR